MKSVAKMRQGKKKDSTFLKKAESLIAPDVFLS